MRVCGAAIICAVICYCLQQTKAKTTITVSEEVHLINDLLERTKASGHRLARPVRKVKDKVTVEFGLSLVQILDMDEKNQIITLNLWKHYSWYDHFHSWNASEYGGVKKVSLPSGSVWTPDIVLYDNIERRDIENHQERLILHSDGKVEWIPYVVYRSACAVNMSNFPFDTQNCTFKFGSWTYSGREVDLVFMEGMSTFSLHQLLPNIEWIITNTSAVRNAQFYECCPDEIYIDLTFSLVITRQWGFFFKFMLLPALLLSCLSLVIFWIPPARPDRTGLGTSLMGSFMLLLILVTQISPPSEDIKFVTYICCNMIMVGLATLVSCSMVNLSVRNTQVPESTKQMLRPLSVLFCVVKPSCIAGESSFGNCPNNKPSQDAEKNLPESNNPLLNDSKSGTAKGRKSTVNYQSEWLLIVKTLDRIMFLLFLIAVTVLAFLFFPKPQ